MERWDVPSSTPTAPIRRITSGREPWSVIYSHFHRTTLLAMLIFDIDLSRANLWGGRCRLEQPVLHGVGIAGSVLLLPFS